MYMINLNMNRSSVAQSIYAYVRRQRMRHFLTITYRTPLSYGQVKVGFAFLWVLRKVEKWCWGVWPGSGSWRKPILWHCCSGCSPCWLNRGSRRSSQEPGSGLKHEEMAVWSYISYAFKQIGAPVLLGKDLRCTQHISVDFSQTPWEFRQLPSTG